MKTKITTKIIALIAIIAVATGAIAVIPRILYQSEATTKAPTWDTGIGIQNGQYNAGKADAYNYPDSTVPFRETKEDREEYWYELQNYYELVTYPGNNAEFNALAYYVNYPDLQQAFNSRIADTVKFKPTDVYRSYLNVFPDALYNHYKTSGKKEGRIANKIVSPYGTFDINSIEGDSYIRTVIFMGAMQQATNRLNAVRRANGLNAVTLDPAMCYQDSVWRWKTLKHHCATQTCGTGGLIIDDFFNQNNLNGLDPSEGHRMYLLQTGVTKVGYAYQIHYSTKASVNDFKFEVADDCPMRVAHMIRDNYINNYNNYGSVEIPGGEAWIDVWLQ